MATNSTIKGRKTKLSKKTKEELINIILKKDNIEKKLNAKTSNLVEQIKALNTDITELYKNNKEIREKNENLKNRLHSLTSEEDKITLKAYALETKLNNETVTKNNALKRLNYYKYSLFIGLIIVLILLGYMLIS